MFLSQMIYASRVRPATGENDIQQILQASRANNSANDVTGILLFSHEYFLQCLEGSRDNVNELYNKILSDDRHFSPNIMFFRSISERDFEEWSMGYIPQSSLTAPIILRFCCSSVFNPYDMSSESTHSLLLKLRDAILTT